MIVLAMALLADQLSGNAGSAYNIITDGMHSVVPTEGIAYEENDCVVPFGTNDSIKPTTSMYVRSLIHSGVKCVVISYRGGLTSEAIGIAQAANERNVTLLFNGECSSACIAIAVLAESAHFTSNSFLLAHATVDIRYEIISDAYRRSNTSVRRLPERVARYQHHTVEQMVSPKSYQEYSVDSMYYLNPSCVVVEADKLMPYDHEGIMSEYEYFLVSKEMLLDWRRSRHSTYVSNQWPAPIIVKEQINTKLFLDVKREERNELIRTLPVCNTKDYQ